MKTNLESNKFSRLQLHYCYMWVGAVTQAFYYFGQYIFFFSLASEVEAEDAEKKKKKKNELLTKPQCCLVRLPSPIRWQTSNRRTRKKRKALLSFTLDVRGAFLLTHRWESWLRRDARNPNKAGILGSLGLFFPGLISVLHSSSF